METDGEWAHVRKDGAEGYVLAEHLRYYKRLDPYGPLLPGVTCYPYAARALENVDILSAETGEIAIYILLFSAVIDSVLWPPSFMLPNSFRATGDVKYPMVISVASMWVFRVGLSWLLGKGMNMGIKAVWYGMSVDWLFRGVMYYARYFGKNWRRRIGDVGN